MILCTLNFLVFCFVLPSLLHVIRQLAVHGSDQLEKPNLLWSLHTLIFTFDDLCTNLMLSLCYFCDVS